VRHLARGLGVVTAAAVAVALGQAPGVVAGLAVVGLGVVVWEARRARRADPASWAGPALRRGRGVVAAAWMIEVREGQAAVAAAFAERLRSHGARATFFVAPDDGPLANALVAAGMEVAWLGLPWPTAGEGSRLPAGVVVRGEPSRRARYWRPRGGVPTAGERQASHVVGATLVIPTLVLGRAQPDGVTVVATDLVLVPADLAGPTVDAWLASTAGRAVRVTSVSEAVDAGADS